MTLTQSKKASMADSRNTMVLVKEAQAARVRAHIRAMVSRLVARTRKGENQPAKFAELPFLEGIALRKQL
ncbi:hypothetical protein BB934_03735 [Microvirga ossetica]|uniref:Uncharacterized protein n=1 Tax=Microvirga ossetica TaxID=1882682 RepID=A0A1B2EC43_9HYPH|nr:hypothetical protein BB934_03735 [Microvirga ossetica]